VLHNRRARYPTPHINNNHHHICQFTPCKWAFAKTERRRGEAGGGRGGRPASTIWIKASCTPPFKHRTVVIVQFLIKRNPAKLHAQHFRRHPGKHAAAVPTGGLGPFGSSQSHRNALVYTFEQRGTSLWLAGRKQQAASASAADHHRCALPR